MNYQKTIVVTGAAGLIGRELLRIMPSNWKAYAITRRPTEFGRPNVQNLVLDLSHTFDASHLPKEADHVVHLAQSNHFRNFPDQAVDILDVNVRSTVSLLDYARKRGLKSVVLASSGGIYGNRESSFGENEPIHVNQSLGFYLNSRLAAEVLAESYENFYPVVVLRYFFAYGPTQREDMLIPRLIRSVRQGEEIKINGENGITMNPIYVEDAAKATLNALGLKSSEKINIAGSEIVNLRQICNAIGEKIDRSPNIVNIGAGTQAGLIGGTEKMQRLLGASVFSLSEGLNRMISGKSKET